ncbi:CPBP family intramembrane glutamic endopeptidase [Psychrobacter sp. HD31]|uniref:CPBP family intramembrane glutamic endopeptidase n=1 Tax=Psychrobacter sp. HD31 TaxID=3112003 RepID=UPI003DA65858
MSKYNQFSQSLFGTSPLFGKVGTFFLIVFVLLFFVVTQVATLVMAAFLLMPAQMATDIDATMAQVVNNGTAISVSSCLTFVVMYFLIATIVKLRKKAINQYLPVVSFDLNIAIKAFALWVLFVVGNEFITDLTNRNPMVFMDEIYATADPLWLLVLSLVIIVPIYEELIFRGVLWKATAEQFVNQKKGAIFASVLMALIFALVHVQYDFFEMASIFILALILGYARYRSGSVLLPILMHVFNNGLALWQYSLTVGNLG